MHPTIQRFWPADPWRLVTFVALCGHAVLGSAAVTLGVTLAVYRAGREFGFYGASALALLVSAAVGVALGLVGTRWYHERVGVPVAGLSCAAAIPCNLAVTMAFVLQI